jgi:hypothetical protein
MSHVEVTVHPGDGKGMVTGQKEGQRTVKSCIKKTVYFIYFKAYLERFVEKNENTIFLCVLCFVQINPARNSYKCYQ